MIMGERYSLTVDQAFHGMEARILPTTVVRGMMVRSVYENLLFTGAEHDFSSDQVDSVGSGVVLALVRRYKRSSTQTFLETEIQYSLITVLVLATCVWKFCVTVGCY